MKQKPKQIFGALRHMMIGPLSSEKEWRKWKREMWAEMEKEMEKEWDEFYPDPLKNRPKKRKA